MSKKEFEEKFPLSIFENTLTTNHARRLKELLWAWIEEEIKQARVKQLEDAKAYAESKINAGHSEDVEKVMVEMSDQFGHLIKHLKKKL